MSIVVSELSKSFGERKVLDRLSFEIGKQTFTLLGPNGAGKTTLVNIICGLLKYDSGKVSVCGFDPRTQTQQVRRRIGLVTQDTSIYDYLTARENLTFHANFYGVPARDVKRKVDEALALAHLEQRANDLAGTFSGGMKRRLALVRAMLHDPEIIILDEPTLGVDVQNRNEIWNKILAMQGKKTIFINTNYMDEAESLSDVCAVIDGGRVVAIGPPDSLKTDYSDGVQLSAEIEIGGEELARLQPKLKAYSSETVITQQKCPNRYRVYIPAKKKPNLLLTDVAEIFNETEGLVIKDLQVRVPTLDDVFLKLTGKKLRD
ncbi:MAG TPA: ABC transporter ATP-binding protein [Eubacteriales bacterium]|nr:ABC transporter ATP-binding protein [Eubacteriales bacterium]